MEEKIKSKYCYGLTMLGSALFAFSIPCFIYKQIYSQEFIVAWFLAYVNHVSGWVIKKKGINKDAHQFFVYAVGFNTLRAFIFLGILLAILSKSTLAIYPFLISIFTAYIVFMAFDLIALQQLSKNSIVK